MGRGVGACQGLDDCSEEKKCLQPSRTAGMLSQRAGLAPGSPRFVPLSDSSVAVDMFQERKRLEMRDFISVLHLSVLVGWESLAPLRVRRLTSWAILSACHRGIKKKKKKFRHGTLATFCFHCINKGLVGQKLLRQYVRPSHCCHRLSRPECYEGRLRSLAWRGRGAA